MDETSLNLIKNEKGKKNLFYEQIFLHSIICIRINRNKKQHSKK